MVQRWTVGDLDTDCLFAVNYNRDVETASRFSFPVPNMLDETGTPLIQHPNIFFKTEKDGTAKIDPKTGCKDYRFRFRNEKDNAEQGVKIDGTGCIMFMSPSDTKSAAIKRIIKKIGADKDGCTPHMLEQAIQDIYLSTGIGDRWNESKETLAKKYDPTDDVEESYFGRFVYKSEISAAIHLGGHGLFDGPADSDQNFHGGAFIIFPGKSLEDARSIIAKYDPLDPVRTRGGAKLVQHDVFLQTRRLPEGTPITPARLTRQDKPKRRYYEISPVAGFSDYNPDVQAVEGDWIKTMEKVFALYGYPRIKTRAVEELGILRLEEGIDRERSQIFEIRRAFDSSAKPEYGLRFDHTVPLARYIAENNGLGAITLPFKSARIGPVWREQPITRGQYKEFVQADIDVVGDGYVPLEYDAEFPRIMCDVAQALGIGTIELGISNRKITKGFFSALGFDDELTDKIIRIIEQRDILGSQGLQARLYELMKLDKALATRCVEFAMIKSSDSAFANEIFKLCKPNKLLEEGIEELMSVVERLQDIETGTVQADMSIVRGMNYYTGTVYEGRCKDSPSYPPIIVGGRYDNLVGHFMKESRPGVGASFEVTRAIDLMRDSGRLPLKNYQSTNVLIIYKSDIGVLKAELLARELRAGGHAVEIAYGSASEENKINYASAKKIPEVVIVGDDDNIDVLHVGDMSRKTVSATSWSPAPA